MPDSAASDKSHGAPSTPHTPAKSQPPKNAFIPHHSLGITAISILGLWIILYCFSSPNTHIGSFFGNAIADWSGVVLMVYATKYLYEKGSTQSRKPPKTPQLWRLAWAEEHSLTIFLGVTWIFWILAFSRMDAQSRWGQVVGNIVSEWTQALGLVVLTKHMVEYHSKP